MGWLNLFKKKDKRDDEIKPSKEVLLNQREEQIFGMMKTKPFEPGTEIRKISKDKILSPENGYKINDNEILKSLQELLEFLKRKDNDAFNAFWQENKTHVKTWIASNFEESFARIIVNFNTKDDVLESLSNYLYPSIEVHIKPARSAEFARAVEDTITKYQEIKDKVKNARKLGVNTFISQTKLMNIKPKIDYCESAQDISGLETIKKALLEIQNDLEYEKKLKKEEEENAIGKPGN